MWVTTGAILHGLPGGLSGPDLNDKKHQHLQLLQTSLSRPWGRNDFVALKSKKEAFLCGWNVVKAVGSEAGRLVGEVGARCCSDSSVKNGVQKRSGVRLTRRPAEGQVAEGKESGRVLEGKLTVLLTDWKQVLRKTQTLRNGWPPGFCDEVNSAHLTERTRKGSRVASWKRNQDFAFGCAESEQLFAHSRGDMRQATETLEMRG